MQIKFRAYPFWLFFFACCALGCGKQASESVSSREAPQATDAVIDSETQQADELQQAEQLAVVDRVKEKVGAFCGNCHAMPRPTSSTREEWIDEVNQGFVLYGESGRNDLDVPSYNDVLNFFQYQAPEELLHWKQIVDDPPCPVAFDTVDVGIPDNRPPGVTNVRWIDIGMKDSKALVYCDIGTGAIKAHWPQVAGRPTERLATLLQPVHTEPCDLNQDGQIDLVAADIGEFNADDSDFGRVVWLRREPGTEKFTSIVLQDNLGRVADVQPGDFDGDGDEDVLVGVFGWRTSGRIILLENEGTKGSSAPKFTLREIDGRHGPVNVPTVDLNKDGNLDFVALIGQEHEVIEAFINDGTGQFKTEVIYRAPDPAYGSSGIQLIDFDRDGDIDVLYTNGDSFDRGPKPYHSVQWLENRGEYPFVHHSICKMPGVLNAKAGDFDGDGDLDVVAVSLLAEPVNDQLSNLSTSSVVMLTQTSPGKFERSQMEGSQHQHISLEVDDLDGDGKTDCAIGNFLRIKGADQSDLRLWMNRSPNP
jgi:hypothetical protein